MTGPFELRFNPADPEAFVDQLWDHLPAHPDGVLIGVLHLIGDRGQILVSVSTPQVGQLVVLPGQILRVEDPADAGSWHVIDGPDTDHLRLPQ